MIKTITSFSKLVQTVLATDIRKGVVKSIDFDKISVVLSNSSTIIRNLEVIGSVQSLLVGSEVSILKVNNQFVALVGGSGDTTVSYTPEAHAYTHAIGGSDPVTPASIGAALVNHTHAGGTGGVTAHNLLTGLGADDHTQYLLANGTRSITGQLVSTVAGVAPFSIASNLLVTNLNADLLDGAEGITYLNNARHDLTARHTLGTVVPHDAHSALSGLTTGDDHTQYLNTTRHDTTTRHTLGTVVPHDAHSALSGLTTGDDHIQYVLADGTRTMIKLNVTGNVGLGITAPNTRLSVMVPWVSDGDEGALVTAQTSTSTLSGLYSVAQDVSSGYGALSFKTLYGTLTEKMRIAANGYVGIGTTSPSYLLEVSNPASNVASSQVRSRNLVTNGGYSAVIGTVNNSGNGLLFNIYSSGSYTTSVPLGFSDYANLGTLRANGTAGLAIYTDNTSDLRLGVNNAATLTIQGTSGNVGIGTTAPGAELQVVGYNTSNPVLIAKAAASQSANILEIRSSTNALLSSFNATGALGVGASAQAYSSAEFYTAWTDPTVALYGIRVYPSVTLTANNAKSLYGGYFAVAAGGGYNFSTLEGVFSVASNNSTAGTLSTLMGVFGLVQNLNTGTVTSASGLQIGAAVNNGGGTITTNYGLYIGDQTVGVTNYAIATKSGRVLFGDYVTIAGSGDRVQMQVRSVVGQTANLQEWQKSDASALALIDHNGYLNVGDAVPTAQVSVSLAGAGGNIIMQTKNTDNTNAASNAMLVAVVGGNFAGDPILALRTASVIDWSVGIDNSDADKLKIGPGLYPGTNTKFTIDANGLVGIGTESPAALLDISSASNPILRIYDTAGTGPIIKLKTGGNEYRLSGGVGGGTGGGIKFGQVGLSTSEIVFTGDGNVGIGTITPAAKLHVVGTADDQQLIVRGFLGQSSNLQEWQTSASAVVASISNGGTLTVSGHLLPALTDCSDIGTSTKLFRKGWLSEIDAILFAKNTITLLGGWFMVTKGEGTFPADVTAVATNIDFGSSLGTVDASHHPFILMRAALQVEYMQVTALVSGTTYTVTRNLDGTGANTWVAGTPWVQLGVSGDGRIELNAYDTPRISMIRQGITYNAQTEYIRIGDLNGIAGIAVETWGAYIGSGSNYLLYDGTTLTVAGDGSGLTSITGGNITTGSITATQIAAHTITAAQIVAGTITATEIAAHTITAAQITAGTITATEIAATSITAAKIVAGTITATQIAAGTITAALIGTNEIIANTANLKDAVITTAKIADAQITTAKIGNLQVTAAQIALATIDTAQIKDLAVTTAKIGLLQVTSAQIALATITDAQIGSLNAGKITAGYIDAARINTGTLTGGMISLQTILSIKSATFGADGIQLDYNAGNPRAYIGDGASNYVKFDGAVLTIAGNGSGLTSITGGNITAGTITATQIAATTITAAKIVAGTITSNEIAAHTITAANITAGTITATEIAATTITAAKLNVTDLSAISANLGTISVGTANIANLAVTAAKIALATIDTAQIADLAVETAKIDNLAVTTAKIGLLQVTAATIALATITDAQIASATITSAKIAALDAGKITTGYLNAGRIAAGTITAAMLSVTDLSAVNTNTGNLTVTGTLNISTGSITAGQTALSSGGISVVAGTSSSPSSAYKFSVSGANIGGLYAYGVAGSNHLLLENANATGSNGVQIGANSTNGFAGINLVSMSGSTFTNITITSDASNYSLITMVASSIQTYGQLGNDSTISAAKGFIATGASFPAGPVTGQMFFHSGFEMWAYWNGANWLTVQEYSASSTRTTGHATNGEGVYIGDVRTDYAAYVTRVKIRSAVFVTNNATNYWSIAVRGANTVYSGSTTAFTANTSADVTSLGYCHEGDASTHLMGANSSLFDMWLTKVGGPGTLDISVAVYYRLILA